MRRILIFVLIFAMLFAAPGCKKEESVPLAEPELTQMKNIFELAVMDCYFHNVAKYFKQDAQKGFLGIGAKDKEFWIEYDAVVTLGIDVSRVIIDMQDNKITISLPPAQIISYKVEPLQADQYYVAKDSADVVAEDEVEAFKLAETELKKVVQEDKELLSNAQLRAKKLLESYILNISTLAQKTYVLEWVYLDEAGQETGRESQSIGTEPTDAG